MYNISGVFMIKLFTDRLIIRDPILDDLQTHHELMSDNTVMDYLQDIKTNTIEESKNSLLLGIKESETKDRKLYFFRIEEKKSNEYVGQIGYTVMQNTPYGKLVQAGYFIRDKYWNKGYITEALKRLIEFAFNEDNVYRIQTGCFKENVASEKVMQKCGFIKEAEYKEFALHEGKLKDRVEYRLLKHEWKG
jgi:ribosomal-protein-alanine N-acetyltransferase